MEKTDTVRKESGSPLAIVAGTGDIPQMILDVCQSQGRAVFGVGIYEQTPPNLFTHIPHAFFNFGEVKKLLACLHNAHVQDIVFAGAMKRPRFSGLELDRVAMQWIAKIGWRVAGGDDGLLSAITHLFVSEGFRIVSTQEILGEILATSDWNIHTEHITPQDKLSIMLGVQHLKHLATLDVGQAIVVSENVVLGIEAAEGTDALISRCAQLLPGKKPILVKMAKTHQSTRIDLPTVGLHTLEMLHQHGYAGMAIEAHKTQMVDAVACQRYALERNLFIKVLSETDIQQALTSSL